MRLTLIYGCLDSTWHHIHQMDELARLFNWTQIHKHNTPKCIHILAALASVCERGRARVRLCGWMWIWIQYFVIWLWFLTVSIHTIKCLRSNKHQIDTLKSRDNRISFLISFCFVNIIWLTQTIIYCATHSAHNNRSLALALALSLSSIAAPAPAQLDSIQSFAFEHLSFFPVPHL